MKVQDTIRKETRIIALGCFALTALMLLVFLLFDHFDLPALLGGILGFATGVLDFFLLGLTVQKAAEIQAAHPFAENNDGAESENDGDEEEEASSDPHNSETAALIRRKVQRSYFARRAMMILVAVTGFTKWVSLPAVVIPLIFPKIVIQLRNLFIKHKKGGD